MSSTSVDLPRILGLEYIYGNGCDTFSPSRQEVFYGLKKDCGTIDLSCPNLDFETPDIASKSGTRRLI